MNKVHARSKSSKQSTRKRPQPGTTPADRRLLAQAERETAGLPQGVVPPAPAATEDGAGMAELRIKGAVRALRLGCDQLSQAIAGARQADDFHTVDNLTPVLASIWSARMELGDSAGVRS